MTWVLCWNCLLSKIKFPQSVSLNFNFSCYKSTCLTMFALWTIFSDHSHWGVTLFFCCRKPCFWTRMGLYYTQQSLWKMVVTKTSPRFEIGDRHQVFLTDSCSVLHIASLASICKHWYVIVLPILRHSWNRMCHSWLHTKQRDLNCYDSWFVEQRWLSNGQSTCG